MHKFPAASSHAAAGHRFVVGVHPIDLAGLTVIESFFIEGTLKPVVMEPYVPAPDGTICDALPFCLRKFQSQRKKRLFEYVSSARMAGCAVACGK